MSTADMVHVSRFEPEVVQALAKRFWRGSEERAPNTPVWKVVSHGVALRSRFRKAEDFARMHAMLDGVEPRWRSAVLVIWCDSIPAVYRVTLNDRFREVAHLIGDQLEDGLADHDGILIHASVGGTLCHLASKRTE